MRKYPFIVDSRPDLCQEWDYDNNVKDINKISEKSMYVANWICQKNPNHKWACRVQHRSNGSKCPKCNKSAKASEEKNFALMHPELLDEWDYEKNGSPEKYAPCQAANVWWICRINPCGCHKWRANISLRTGVNKTGCPYCCNQKLCPHNNFAALFPKIAKEWDYDKNQNKKPENCAPATNEKFWWICQKNPCGCHSWKTAINNRTTKKYGRGCPFCSRQRKCPHNNFKALYPKICEEWNYEKNEKDPCSIAPYSTYRAFWICKKFKHHEWNCPVVNRTGSKQHGCPHCRQSKGEKKISEFLINNEINYETQKKFDQCKHKRRLPFDFYIPEKNLLIEFDGHQHFYTDSYYSTISNFKNSRLHDVIKTRYAIDNDIPFLRISYDEFDHIEDILNRMMKNNANFAFSYNISKKSEKRVVLVYEIMGDKSMSIKEAVNKLLLL